MPADDTDTGELNAVWERVRRNIVVVGVVALTSTAILAAGAFWLAGRMVSTASSQTALGSVLLTALCAPVVAVLIRLVFRFVDNANAVGETRQERLDEERRHRLLESQVADALEMSESEPEALRTLERTFAAVVPDAMTELLLADNSQAHLERKAVVAPDAGVSGCGVGSPQDCPAARRARVHRFEDSEAVNACPKLRDRAGGPCGAVCIPVSVMGRTVGVIHTVHDKTAPIEPHAVADLQSIANQAGARLGMLRIMAETQLQAETDGLTGLMNRRAFENGFVRLRQGAPHGAGVTAMVDLDHFKKINDTHGHETGDRALRTFADTLRRTVRANDLVARYGGEEFAIVFPECNLDAATGVLERVREELARAVVDAGLPTFTASFGVTPSFLSEDLDLLLARADAALFEAKRSGRDRIVAFTAADLDGSAERDVLLADTGPDPLQPDGAGA